mgnify:CR=1 FL=1
MEQKKRRFAVLTGGGDCPGLNAVIRAVVKTFLQNDCEVYGVLNGFNGLINDNLKSMDYAAVSGILPRGGTILGTTNRDNPFHFAVEENGELVYKDMREKVIENLRKYDIEALVVIGGDGSLNIGAWRVNVILRLLAYPRPLIMICPAQSGHSALILLWLWLPKRLTDCILQPNHITVLWCWRLWAVMPAGLLCTVVLPAVRTLFCYRKFLTSWSR